MPAKSSASNLAAPTITPLPSRHSTILFVEPSAAFPLIIASSHEKFGEPLKFTSVSFVHPANGIETISDNDSGSETSSSAVQSWNALSPRDSPPAAPLFLIMNVFNEVHPSNSLSGTFSTVSRITLCTAVFPANKSSLNPLIPSAM